MASGSSRSLPRSHKEAATAQLPPILNTLPVGPAAAAAPSGKPVATASEQELPRQPYDPLKAIPVAGVTAQATAKRPVTPATAQEELPYDDDAGSGSENISKTLNKRRVTLEENV